MKKIPFLLLSAISTLIISCTGSEQNQGTSSDSLSVVTQENPLQKNGIRLSELENSPEYPDAKIVISKPRPGDYIKPGKVKFEFKVENFPLTVQTGDADHKRCANSSKGQHIHFILNNGPYEALYEPSSEPELDEGHYTLLTFLSRSYHESVKSKKAFAITQFVVGKPENIDTIVTEDYDTGELYKTEIAHFSNGKKQQLNLKLDSYPYLFYSRPKGTYTGDETKRVMLDFYLVNAELSEKGNKVRLMVDSTEFILTKWVPYFIEGLAMGEHKISITLLDEENNPVFWAAPFYESGERTIILQETEPVASGN